MAHPTGTLTRAAGGCTGTSSPVAAYAPSPYGFKALTMLHDRGFLNDVEFVEQTDKLSI
ncbi:hypothetical protein [Subtercola endophyticus]|uniref:hypothetical protein n=1 Tax=Subtercola endophyticus TaxID=2895559 RepID=UPI001E5B2C36|nr:hypothetical protein [Subtercola endophyticus]UFS59778.1 hypothetical protein LQ955_03005 [Subtercola endophyticus]